MGCARLTGLILLGIFVAAAAARCGAAEPAKSPPNDRLVQVWVNIGEDPRDWVATVGATGGMATTLDDLLVQVKAALAERARAGVEAKRAEVVIFAVGWGSTKAGAVCAPMLESFRKLGVGDARLGVARDSAAAYGLDGSARPKMELGIAFADEKGMVMGEVPAGTSDRLGELARARKSSVATGGGGVGVGVGVGSGRLEGVHLDERGVLVQKLNGFFFVCDASAASAKEFELVRSQIRPAIDALKPVQTFGLVACRDGKVLAMDEHGRVLGIPEMKRKAYTFLDEVKPAGGGGVVAGMKAALAADPRKIFLLTPGDPPDGEELLKLFAPDKNRRGPLPIVNVLNTDRDGKTRDATLKKIAEASGGWVMRLTDDKQLLARAVVPKVYQMIAVDYRPDYSWSAAFWDDLGSARSQKQFAALVEKAKEKFAKEGTKPEEVDLLLRINSATGVPDELVKGMRKAVADAGFTMAHSVVVHDEEGRDGRTGGGT